MVKDLLNKVINGEVEEINIPFTPIAEIEEILEDLKISTIDVDVDTNGWEVDFWNIYENKYQLSGSLYYGRFVFKKL